MTPVCPHLVLYVVELYPNWHLFTNCMTSFEINQYNNQNKWNNQITNGTIVLGMTNDEPTVSLGPALPMLLGAGINVTDVGISGMFAFVIQRGYPVKTVLVKSNARPTGLSLAVTVTRTGLKSKFLHFELFTGLRLTNNQIENNVDAEFIHSSGVDTLGTGLHWATLGMYANHRTCKCRCNLLLMSEWNHLEKSRNWVLFINNCISSACTLHSVKSNIVLICSTAYVGQALASAIGHDDAGAEEEDSTNLPRVKCKIILR